MANKKSNTFDYYIGNRVRARRITLGMSQEKLGDALGVTFQQVQKYEKGTNRIGAGRLQNISQVLEVSPSYFFEEISEPVAMVIGGSEAADSDAEGACTRVAAIRSRANSACARSVRWCVRRRCRNERRFDWAPAGGQAQGRSAARIPVHLAI